MNVANPTMKNEMTDIGAIKMRMPNGRQSVITVSLAPTGAIDIHMSRSSEGEALLRLPIYAAKELSDLLAKALTTREGQDV